MSLVFSLMVAAGCAMAQTTQTASEPIPSDTMTLHVIVRELQVAALVLDEHRRPVANVDPRSFRLQIETRPKFQPMRVHRQGDDPISLAVLLDMSQKRKYLDQLPDALAELRETALLPHDRLLLAAVDCRGLVYRGDTSTPEAVREGAKELLGSALLHNGTHNGRPQFCSDRAHIWDELGNALRLVAAEPGRHAVLLVSEGDDFGSKSTVTLLEEYATNIAGTVFMLPSIDMSGPFVRRSPLDPLVMLSGGAVLDPVGKDGIARSFLECIEMLRDRFILGFNQPANLKNGHNDLHVSIAHASYDIRSSGVSTPGDVPVLDRPGSTTAGTSTPHQP